MHQLFVYSKKTNQAEVDTLVHIVSFLIQNL